MGFIADNFQLALQLRAPVAGDFIDNQFRCFAFQVRVGVKLPGQL
ncbi:hypothetical protein O185_25950 [Photorhabdus temperata J3]|uniref:Uncharacterized protein n=1 Tax=Photorhabdus temperata J3 TaxID=1389415 RepID=U7QSK3_PHOTE|nr:hypothetical protein O185_25950 [Photorhabdus temperata J3]